MNSLREHIDHRERVICPSCKSETIFRYSEITRSYTCENCKKEIYIEDLNVSSNREKI